MAGFGLNLKLVLYLQSQCLTESLSFPNPPLPQAAKRYHTFEKTELDKMNRLLFLIFISFPIFGFGQIENKWQPDSVSFP
ncbi:MAG: hypothetical protein CVU03_14200 [Bacteroidetes bacterium HGW-Bacteroidetes-2]|jgi:hypothetical protein|nr:MAG: hypothetical protein CVU03_14200 [Bacteroidetes bacterium HGW-Bacteroidetes-2]